ncbi:MAG: putative oxidoreductase molybdopterin-binding subunit, partial [Conexibacter sp.]|nr:putative oxidoreductase molybdopterin-binding subunit [Conexibacter sp.]
MKAFAYDRATDPEAAVALLAADPQAKLLGGGTNLIDLMKLGVETPAALVDVSALDRRQVEELGDGGLRIGAAVRNSELAAVPAVRERFPLLSMALLSGASGQLRNMATTGGNLFQRTRCVYFMDATKPCNKRDPGSGCPAIEGDHRNLAILGASEHCVATHPSDMAVALAALDAVVCIQGPDGRRALPICELHRLPGATPEQDTTLAREEIVTAIEIPALPGSAASSYRKVRDRASYAFAVASVAAVLVVDDDGSVSEARLALGGVAHKPW